MKNRERLILSFAVPAILLVAFLSFGFSALAQESPATTADPTIDDLKQKIEAKNAEVKKLEEEAKQYRDEIVYSQNRGKTLKEELTRVDKTIKSIRSDITVTERKIERASLEIAGVNIDIKSKELSMQKMRNGLGAMLESMSENDQDKLLKILFQRGPFSDFFRQLDHISLLQKKILSALDSLRTIKKELEVKKAEAQEKKDELQGLNSDLRGQKTAQESVRQDKNQILKITQNQEKKYQTLLQTTQQKEEAILKEIEQLEAELRLRVDPNSLPAQRNGFFDWPINGSAVTQGYGETPFTKTARDFYKFHNGIDLRASIGTPVRAPYDGVVMATGDTDRYCYRGAYGRYIVIDHQNNLATLYGHLSSIKVTRGQTIQRGDIIGYSGNTGLSTGPHLHFTVYDSRTVEIKLGSTGACGPMPFGGSLNPLVYL